MYESTEQTLPVRSLSKILNKPKDQFQRKDLLAVIKENNINQINLHYVGLDEKLKELKIPINNPDYAELILAQGERIDGSSIFPKIVDPAYSDLYIVPIYKTAFISPFEENTLGICCRFIDKDGQPAAYTPDNILINCHNHLKNNTGYALNALAELEFYIIYDRDDSLFTGLEQQGYHQSSPFVKKRRMMNEMLKIISNLTGAVKYAHSEVGYIDSLTSKDPEINGKCCEQYEIEFLPRPVEEMAYYIAIAKWVVRNVAHRWGCSATFTPKLEEGMAGTGLHFHLELIKNHKNVMVNAAGELSSEALKLIAGLCKYAAPLTAFGNSVSSAYLRLVSNQEAPTRICWSRSNRASLIRVPLGWSNIGDIAKQVNPNEGDSYSCKESRQTVEIRTPDGSAFVTLMLAGLTLAAENGLTDPASLQLAEETHLENLIEKGKKKLEDFTSLPPSCADSATVLQNERQLFEKNRLFPAKLIDHIINELNNEDDKNINERFSKLPADKRLSATRDIMHRNLHKH